MVYNFGGNYAAKIADVSSDPAYMNATIMLKDATTHADMMLNPVPARIIGIRSQNDVASIAAGNPTGAKGLRIQIPHDAYAGRIGRGTFVQVVDGGRNPALTGYLIVVEADNFSSQQASRTLECAINVEVVNSWA